jgi:diguanylate cyclase (GGDEF)-like protein
MPPSITPLDHGKDDQDDLVFLEEHPAQPATTAHRNVWRVMIIDDDEDVHSTTTFALGNLDMQHRPLEFVHAYSAAQARELLQHEQEIAVILLDVVMEQDDAGLHLVRYIRETLKLADVRIILRTGQPGYAPEIDAIRDFDINDYKTKSELTRIKLFTTVTAAIRSYEQIRNITESRHGLSKILTASTELMALHGMQNFAAGVLAQAAGVLSQETNGLLCIQECPDAGVHELVIVATAGSFTRLTGKQLKVEDDARVHQALERCLAARRNIYGPDYVTLHFAGKASHTFVAFLDVTREASELEQGLLDVFCSNVAVGLENVELVSHLHTAAFYDNLSKLPNRTRLIEILDATLAGPAKQEATLSLVDLDHFAETNDALGHEFGDLLLSSVAARMQSSLGQQLTVARIGGDIFCVLGDSAQVNPANILALFAKPFSIEGQDVQLSATLGLVRLSEHDGSGADALKDADIALKRAKSQQRAGHFYFSRSMGVEIRERVRMMHALRTAFGQNQLFVVYQPQIDLLTRKPVGAEALLRWQTREVK